VCCKIGFLVLLEGEVDAVFEFEVKRIQIVSVWLTVGDLGWWHGCGGNYLVFLHLLMCMLCGL
jgi:hypothetical protein